MEQARALVEDIRTILIVDAQQDDLVAAGQSSADAVLDEADCFTEDKPVIALSRSLALGQRYRSSSVLAALSIDGLRDREIAQQLGISYEAARSRGKALRRKLGAGNRAQVVAKALQLGLGRLVGG